MEEVYIVSAVRTPIGAFNGVLSGFSATELGSLVITEAVRRSGLAKDQVDEVIMGNVLPGGLGQNPARQAMMKAELPFEVGAITVNKVCGSGLKAVMLAAQAIALKDAEIVVAGGLESMSRAPFFLEKARTGYRMGNGTLYDSLDHDGLRDINNNFLMGVSAELCAEKYQVSRDDQDRFSAASYARALKARAEGKFMAEILPVAVPRKGKDPLVVDQDEVLRETSLETLAGMRPAFKKDGTVTAGNSSKISDGAAALVLMSGSKMKELGIRPLARVGAQGASGLDPKYVLVAPLLSIPKVLKKAGLAVQDIDLQEVNEAFAASTVAVIKELGLDPEKTNVHGGSVALGHPIGASGARVLVTLLYALKDRGAKRGMASLCLGGGEAVSLIVENID
ncbi:MAG: acetyl-CoA C-acetyltransferase [Desulfobacterota bacterium]|jgi:acetyl-CoA C-acetyltransferase|nr:acetyl-CoA C-acetyltransferase [Thermodesulfobacteriota bacterium]